MQEEIDEEFVETIENAKKALAKAGIKDILLVVSYEDGSDIALFAGDVKKLHQSVDFEVNFNDFVEKGYIDPDHLDWANLEKKQNYTPCPTKNRATAEVQLEQS
ncbi:hypothetical protein [Methanobacterium formicicum]|uniref:Uncharacterized protein n=1 Tax=Methanobacterium formicicum TaxID=2162 RepID=A0A090I1E6_METFO|nr:hypothetical protein [Methanobacterium formicicum]MDH2659741.1 hypothetical protein [Methanobacterium formicicum]OPY24749.1 MAG: hypothetical protein A4E26_00139 [Methanobacterium sp. PtaU1.Bin097]CEA12773.1 hypothetical protein DSM1535_0411 [Methanobacterium formicicum]